MSVYIILHVGRYLCTKSEMDIIIYDRSVTIIIITSLFTIKYIGTHTHYIIIYKYTARATAALCIIIYLCIYNIIYILHRCTRV